MPTPGAPTTAITWERRTGSGDEGVQVPQLPQPSDVRAGHGGQLGRERAGGGGAAAGAGAG
ncbi:DEAD/DEAH box helicase, partial [Streptomyces sp. MT29]|nr:DEAD/DEAH box helicase [Streptomyces sp. MT29]